MGANEPVPLPSEDDIVVVASCFKSADRNVSIDLFYTVDQGVVTDVRLEEDQRLSSATTACVESVVAAWRFDLKVSGEGWFPLVYKPKRDVDAPAADEQSAGRTRQDRVAEEQ